MKLYNPFDLPVVASFIRLFGETITKKFEDNNTVITFLPLSDDENEYDDIIVRLGDKIYLSEKEIGRLGLSDPEIFASLAHELGHILYHTHPWGFDAESRADTLAAELGLRDQMISVIDKIITSRRFRNVTSSLVQRIQFLKHLA